MFIKFDLVRKLLSMATFLGGSNDDNDNSDNADGDDNGVDDDDANKSSGCVASWPG